MLLQYILHIFGLLICISQALPSSTPIDHGVESIFRRKPTDSGKARDVNLRLYFSFDAKSTKPNGLTTFPWHTALLIQGNTADPPIKMEIYDESGDWKWKGDFGYDRKVDSNERDIFQAKTTLTNDQIIDKAGAGPAWDALVQDPEYRTGPSNRGKMNTCHNFAARMLNNMGIQVTDEAQKWMAAYDTETETKDDTKPVKSLQITERKPGARKGTVAREFKVPPGKAGKSGCKKRDGDCAKAIVSEGDDGRAGPWQNELITLKDQSGLVPEDFRDPSAFDTVADAKPPPPGTVHGPKGATVGFAKAGGVLKTFTMVGKEALGALGVAGTVAGALFVILDFVGHDWVGGAIGSVGLVAGAVAGFAISGPIGWVVGGAIMALFASMSSL